VSICSDSQGALKTLQTARATSPLVQQYQKTLNDACTRHTVGLYWVPGRAGEQENEIAYKLARDGSVETFVGPEPSFGVSRQNIRRNLKCWVDNKFWKVGDVLVVLRDRLEN